MHHIRGKSVLELELYFYRLYKDKTVCRTFAFHVPFITVFDTEIIKDIMVKRFNDFPNRFVIDFNAPSFERALTIIQNDHWKHVRGIITPTFTSGKLKKMMRLIRGAADSLTQGMEEKAANGEFINLKDVMGAFTMDVIASTMFGIQVDSQKNPDDPFVTNAKKAFNLSLSDWKFLLYLLCPPLGRVFKKFGLYLVDKNTTKFFESVIDQVLEERKNGTQEYVDFMQLMVDDEVGRDSIDKETTISTGTTMKWSTKGILREEIISNAMIFFLAGYDTTATTLSTLAYCLAMNPEVQEKVIAEIDEKIGDKELTYDTIQQLEYLDMAMSETLRLYPPVIRVDRISSTDVTIKGFTFPKGISVGFSVYGLHHDPDVWPEPHKFDPERFTPEAKAARDPYYYMPFGLGQRSCVGMRLATVEIKVAMATFFAKNKFVTCDETPVKLEFESLGLLRFKKPVILKVESRKK